MTSPPSTDSLRRPARIVIGLLGGVASGKSAAAAAFAECGAEVLDGDAVARDGLAIAEVKERVRARFGAEAFAADGSVDRTALADRVFRDAGARADLERILHPHVRRELASRLERSTSPAVVLDVPLLVEGGLLEACDVLVFVEAGAATRRGRASRSRGWSADEVDRRDAAQASLDGKRARADFVLDNEGSLEDLRAQVRRIFARVAPTLPAAPGGERRAGG